MCSTLFCNTNLFSNVSGSLIHRLHSKLSSSASCVRFVRKGTTRTARKTRPKESKRSDQCCNYCAAFFVHAKVGTEVIIR